MSEPTEKTSESLVLAESVESTSVGNLLDALLARRSEALVIDAGQVERIDTPCIELFVSAAKQWREDGAKMVVAPISEAMAETLGHLGIDEQQLQSEGSLL